MNIYIFYLFIHYHHRRERESIAEHRIVSIFFLSDPKPFLPKSPFRFGLSEVVVQTYIYSFLIRILLCMCVGCWSFGSIASCYFLHSLSSSQLTLRAAFALFFFFVISSFRRSHCSIVSQSSTESLYLHILWCHSIFSVSTSLRTILCERWGELQPSRYIFLHTNTCRSRILCVSKNILSGLSFLGLVWVRRK